MRSSSFEELDIGDPPLEAAIYSVLIFRKHKELTYLSIRKSKEEVLIVL
jgi:hypothetical protein